MKLSELKIQELSSRKFYPITNDRITFNARLKAEHLFTYVDEATYYIDRIVAYHTIEDDIDLMAGQTFDIHNNMTRTLIINVIDEAIISIIYEVLHQIHRNDISFVLFIQTLIENSKDKIKIHYTSDKENHIKDIWFYEELYIVLNKISYICNPTNEDKREEIISSELALAYYNLMIRLNEGIDDQYNKDLVEYYKSLIYETDIGETM